MTHIAGHRGGGERVIVRERHQEARRARSPIYNAARRRPPAAVTLAALDRWIVGPITSLHNRHFAARLPGTRTHALTHAAAAAAVVVRVSPVQHDCHGQSSRFTFEIRKVRMKRRFAKESQKLSGTRFSRILPVETTARRNCTFAAIDALFRPGFR